MNVKSSSPPTPSATATGHVLNFADVIARLTADDSLTSLRRREWISALHTVSRVLNSRVLNSDPNLPLGPESIEAQPQLLARRLAGVTRGSTGLSLGRWNNVRSLVLAALKHVGVPTMPGRSSEAFAPAWRALEAQLPDKQCRHGLSKFMRYCSEHQISPDAVDIAVFDRFRQALEEKSLVKNPKQAYRTLCTTWNRAAAEIAGWPNVQVAVPNHSRRYALAWDAFPPAFQTDAEAYLNRRRNKNFFTKDYAKAAAPSTIVLRRNQILQIATALVQSGRSPDEITSLAALVEPENAKRALQFFVDREDAKSATPIQGNAKSTTSIHDKAIFLGGLAKHWVKASEADCRTLGEYAKELGVKNRGMTVKNRARLRQFDDAINVHALLGLTDRVLREVRRDDTGHRRDALRAMYAVAVGFLIAAPIRVKNLTSLELERHLERVNSGGQPMVHIIIPDHEVKNGEPFEIALPAATAAILTDYIKTYRGRLSSKPSPWLFPNDEGGRRVTERFSTDIGAFILRETGIKMNVHLFRHLAAKVYLDVHPEDVETVRRLLGHKSVATTLRFYADMKTASCFRRYDDMLADLRQRADAASGRGRRQGAHQ